MRHMTELAGTALLLATLSACSRGPAPADQLIAPTERGAYQRHLTEQGNDPRAAYLAWRAQETGRDIASLAVADLQVSTTTNPFDRNDPWAVRRGAVIYAAHCAICHGPGARGVDQSGTPLPGHKDFRNPHIRMAVGMSDGYVNGWYAKVAQGVTATQRPTDTQPPVMPAMEPLLTREQIWLAITYLASGDKLVREAQR